MLSGSGERISDPEPREVTVDQVSDLVLPEDVGLDPASLVESSHLNLN